MNDIEFKQLLNKVFNDEISAATFYKRAAADLIGVESKNVSDELNIHADEEMGHFNMLIKYASDFGILQELNIVLDQEVANFKVTSLEEVMVKVQDLESQAIADYEALMLSCFERKEVTGFELFKKILHDEIGHYDDLAYVLGQVRTMFSPDMDGIDDSLVGPTTPDSLIEQPMVETTAYNTFLKKR